MAGNRSSASRVGRLTVDLIPDWIFAVGFPPHWKVDYGEYAQEEEARGWLEERTSHIPMRDVIDERYHRRVGRRPSDGEPLPRWCGVDGYGVPLTSRLLPAGAQQLPLAPRPRRATTVSYPDPRRVLDQSTDPDRVAARREAEEFWADHPQTRVPTRAPTDADPPPEAGHATPSLTKERSR